MSREIKFRTFYNRDIKLGKPLLFLQEIFNDELMFICQTDREIMYAFDIPFMDNEWILQQFTALLDKNNKEIYEGDIIQYNFMGRRDKSFGFIEWLYHSFCVRHGSVDYNIQQCDNIEVIGNVYENPELLK